MYIHIIYTYWVPWIHTDISYSNPTQQGFLPFLYLHLPLPTMMNLSPFILNIFTYLIVSLREPIFYVCHPTLPWVRMFFFSYLDYNSHTRPPHLWMPTLSWWGPILHNWLLQMWTLLSLWLSRSNSHLCVATFTSIGELWSPEPGSFPHLSLEVPAPPLLDVTPHAWLPLHEDAFFPLFDPRSHCNVALSSASIPSAALSSPDNPINKQ